MAFSSVGQLLGVASVRADLVSSRLLKKKEWVIHFLK